MDNSRPHLTSNSDHPDGRKKKKREKFVIENGVIYEIIPDANEEWDSDEWELEADYYSTDSKAELDARDGVKEERLKLHDARLDEPRTMEFTMTKFDNLTKRMDGLRAIWDEEAEQNPPLPSSPTPIIDKKTQNSKNKTKPDFSTGIPIHDYKTYHATTIALLQTDKEALDTLYRDFRAKRRELGKTISEKSSMVNLKAGDTLERMVVEMITPGPEEVGEEAYREAVEERRIEREGEIEGARGGVRWG